MANVIDIIDGGTPRTTISEYWHGSIPWLSVSDFNLGYRWVTSAAKSITQLGVSESATTVLDKGDVIISARGTVGVVAQLGRPMAFNQSCYGIRGKPGIADTDFIYYLLHGIVPRLKQVAHGAVFDTITRETFRIVEVNLPPLSEQRAIVRVLGTFDDKIELNRRMNETLEAIAQALFKSWFIDFDPVHAKAEGRDTGLPPEVAALFPDSFEDSELGQIPRGWKLDTVGEHVLNCDSQRVPLSGAERVKRPGAYPYYGAAGIVDYVDDYLFDGIYLLVGEDGSVNQDDGTAMTQYVFGKMWVNNHAHVILGADSVSTEQLYLYFRNQQVGPFITGAVQAKLSQGRMNMMPFLFAGDQVSRAFSDQVEPWFASYRSAVEETRVLGALRDTLLPKLLSGELRVDDVGDVTVPGK